jgi:hypothetical protein
MLGPKGAMTPKKIAEGLRRQREEERERRPEPRPAPPPVQNRTTTVNVNLGGLVSAATWAWDRYTDRQKQVAQEEAKVMELAARNHGWLTESQVVEGLGFSVKAAQACMDRLVNAQLCERFIGRQGFPVYVFPQFLPPLRQCEYCDTEYIKGAIPKCPACGAPEPRADV